MAKHKYLSNFDYFFLWSDALFGSLDCDYTHYGIQCGILNGMCNINKIKLGVLVGKSNTSSSASLSPSLVEELHHIYSNYLFSPKLRMSEIALWTILAINPHIFSTIGYSSSSKPSRPNKSSQACKTCLMPYSIFGNQNIP